MGVIEIFGSMGESFLVIMDIPFYLFESYKYKSVSEAPIIHFSRLRLRLRRLRKQKFNQSI